MRVVIFLLVLICCTSCRFFSLDISRNQQILDTIINFSKVDVSPSFSECKDKIDKAKNDCFRITIHQKIAASLAEYQLEIKDSIDEIIHVELLISSAGKINLIIINSSAKIQKELPRLDSLLKISVEGLPAIFPAIKRGIPVNTQYSLPIRIQLK